MKPIEGLLILEGTAGNPVREFPGFLFGAHTSAKTIREAYRQNRASASPGRIRDRGYGEVVFNTAMTGYQETLSDPSYYGQIVTMTCPHVGNTGINTEDMESSQVWCAGFVIHELPRFPSNWRSNGDLHTFLAERGVPALHGVDTRALTRVLRSQGVMRGILLPRSDRDQAESLLAELPSFEGRDLIAEVTTQAPYDWRSSQKKPGEFLVVVMDFGIKWNQLRLLDQMGCRVKVVPATMSSREILALKPDGVFLSNGPGDPSAATYAIETVRELLGKVPIFAICMGHQILSLAAGGKTYKLKFGHRGSNQPVLNKQTGQVEISSHNHGYAVDAASLPPSVEVGHINLNDKTVEGIRIPSAMAFSVQYHPEASPGPNDSTYLFERFADLMRQFRVPKVS